MNQRRGVGSLLILLEILFLVTVLILGVAKYVRGEDTPAQKTQPEAVKQNEPEQIAVATETEETAEPETQTVLQPEFSGEILAKVQAMTLEQKVAGLFLTTPESLTGNDQVTVAGDGTRTALETYPVAGLVYGDGNFQGRTQFGALLSGAQQYYVQAHGGYLLLAARQTAEDGGTALAISSVYDVEPVQELMASGGMQGEEENILYPQTFPEDAGSLSGDAAYVILSENADASVTGDESLPCTVSPQAVHTLRNDYGYNGVIVSGDLASETVAGRYENGAAAVAAVQAGADVLFVTDGFEASYEALLEAVENDVVPVSRIEEALCRILTAKEAMPEPTDGDILAAGGNGNEG